MTEITPESAATLRGIATGDASVLEGLLDTTLENVEDSGLDRRTHALVRIAALIALDASSPSYCHLVRTALGWGATVQDIVGVLVAVGPQVGSARIVAAAGQLMPALETAAWGSPST